MRRPQNAARRWSWNGSMRRRLSRRPGVSWTTALTCSVTHSQWVPTMFVRMLKLPAEVRERYDISSTRVVIHAAAPCPVEVKQKMMDWFGPKLFEFYSCTEVNGMTVIGPGEWLAKPGSVGRAVLGKI